jgi:hypothetical protein
MIIIIEDSLTFLKGCKFDYFNLTTLRGKSAGFLSNLQLDNLLPALRLQQQTVETPPRASLIINRMSSGQLNFKGHL